MAGRASSSIWPASLQGSLCWSTSPWRRLSQLRQLPQQQLPSQKAVWAVQQRPGPQGPQALLWEVRGSPGVCFFFSTYGFNELAVFCSFQASRPKEKTSRWIPSQLPPGKRRSSAGLQEDARAQASRSTGAGALQQALPPWQTPSTAGPSLPTGSEVSPGLTLAARATCRGQRRGRPELEQQENIKSACVLAYRQTWVLFVLFFVVQGWSHILLLKEKSGLANHKLTVGKGINTYPLYQQNQTILPPLLPPTPSSVTVAVNGLCPEGRRQLPSVILMMEKY